MQTINDIKRQNEMQFANMNLFHTLLFNATEEKYINSIFVYTNMAKLYLMCYNDSTKVYEFEVSFNSKDIVIDKQIELTNNYDNYKELLVLLKDANRIDFTFQLGGSLPICCFETNYNKVK